MSSSSTFRLVTLGRLALVAPDGSEDESLHKRRRKLAVLAVLAMERRPVSRDRLVEMFWGEQPEERARHSLSDALSHLRSVLGRDAITLSRTEVALSAPTALVVDALELTDAAASRQHARVIDTYRGAFLDGFYVADSTTFEHWSDRHRRRLEGLVLAACAAQCTELARSRRWDECADVAARWLELDLASADAALFRLNALKAAGTPSADRRSLVEFEALRARLRRELDLAPDPRVTALADSTARRLADAAPADECVPPVKETPAEPAVAVGALPTPNAVESPLGPSQGLTGRRPRNARWIVAAAAVALLLTLTGFFAVAARRAAPALSPDVVVVMPFAVHGDPDASYLREGMVDLLSTNLDGAGRMRAVDPRASMAHFARLPAATAGTAARLAPDDARAVAHRFGAGLMVLGDVVAIGGRLRINAALYDAGDDGGTRVRAAVDGPASQLFSLVDDLTRQLLGGDRAAPDGLTGLAAQTTTSVPALKSYLAGVSAYRSGRFDAAVGAFRSAADLDTGFALAHYQLSNAMLWSARGSWESVIAESRAALRQESRLGPRARLLVEGYEAFRTGRFDDAERLYRRVAESYPDDVEGAYQLGDLLFHGNGLRGRSFTESRGAFERVLSIEPAHLGALLHLVRVSIAEGRRAEADSLIDRATRVAPPSVRAELAAVRAFAFGDASAQDRAVELLRSQPDEAVRVAAMRVALFARNTEGATRIARLLLAPSRAPEFRGVGHVQLADLALAQGNRAGALAHLDSARLLAPAFALECKALHLVQPFLSVPRAELAAMRDTLRRWDASPPRSSFPMFAVYNGLHAPIRHYLLGMLAVRLGDLDDAEREAAALDTTSGPGDARAFGTGMAWAIRGHVLAERGRLKDALAAYQRAELRVSEGLLDGPFGDQGIERFARADVLRALGRLDEARGWYASLGTTSLDLVVYAAPAAERLAAMERGTRERQ